ncbi:MAG: glycosyltransferase [Candidatus Bathycorpusculaceae bacterium]
MMKGLLRIVLVGYESGSSSSACIYNLGKEMVKKGFLKKMICPNFKSSVDIPRKFLVKEYLPLIGASFLISKVSQYIFVPERFYNEQLLFDIFAQSQIIDADLVLHTDSGLVRTLGKAKRKSIPNVILHRTLHPEHISRILREESVRWGIAEKSVFVHKKWNYNRIRTLKECDKIFALSKLEVESLCRFRVPLPKIELIHHGQGVDVNYFTPPSEKKKEKLFTVLFLGHKSLIKGVPYLLEAWKKLNLKEAKLIVAGYQDKEFIERYRRKVQFEAPGVVNPLKYYHKAHIYILPSLGDSFPRTVLEAMSCGLPVIISDMTGIKDAIEGGREGFIVPARNVDAIAEKILYFYENPSEIRRMGQNAREKAKGYPWKKFSEEVTTKVIQFLEK